MIHCCYFAVAPWLLALGLNPVTLGAIIVVSAYAFYVSSQVSSSSQPFGSGTMVNEVQTKKNDSITYSGFIDTGKYGNTAQQGERETEQQLDGETQADSGGKDGVGSQGGIFTGTPSRGIGDQFGNFADTSAASSFATDTDGNYYPNINPVAFLIEIEKPRLESHNSTFPEPIDDPNPHKVDPDLDLTDINQVNGFNKVELNLPEVDVDRDKWISIELPVPILNVGQTLRQPLIRGTQVLYSAPTTGEEIAIFDPTELVSSINRENGSENYFDNLAKTFLGQNLESEKEIKLSEQAIVLIPIAFISGLSLEPVVGLKALYRIAEAFRSYSLGAMSPPIYNISEKVQINIIDGINENKNPAPINQSFEELVKPFPSGYVEKMANNYLIPTGTKLDVELLMRFLGNTEIYEGGEDEYRKLSDEYKNNPDSFYDSPYIQQSPSINDILNDELPSNGLKLKTNRSSSEVESQFEVIQKMIATSYVKTGLDQFPTKLPSLKDPDFEVDNEGKRYNYQPQEDIVIPSFAGGLGYGIGALQKNIGRFPLEVETDSEEMIRDPNDVNKLIPKKDHQYLPDIATTIGTAVTLGLIGANLGKNNFDLNLRNSKQIESTKKFAQKGASCACATFDGTGLKNKLNPNCELEPVNYSDAKGVQDFFKGKEICSANQSNVDSTTLIERLDAINKKVTILLGSVFKTEEELETELTKVEELRANIDKTNNSLNKYIEDFNSDKSDLAKNYPLKSKITKNKNKEGI